MIKTGIRRKHQWAICLFLMILFMTMLMTTGAAGKANVRNDVKCITRIKISRDDNPWKGMTHTSRQEEMNKNIPAVEFNKGTCEVFPHLSVYQINSESLLGKDKVGKKIVINSRYFSALEKVDATRIPSGTVKPVGRFLDTSFLSLSPRQLVRFLLDAQIITTYWHLESELCMTGEKDEKDGYTAVFTGVHRYCTNRCETERLNFAVRIDRVTGEISVSGH
ncbi:MAG: hypothetical protein H6Q49_1965 [Deltaproteobacteria bacterium]|nr:hypothetical protein [Deltaproteobacteria bacterium]